MCRKRYLTCIKQLAKPPLRQSTGILPSLAGTWGPCPPRGFHSYFTNQKQKVNGAGLTTYFPGALGDRLSASRLTHTLFIQSFKYPIVSVFSMLIFSILMIWSPALALLGLAALWVFFSFFFFFLLFNILQSERGRGLARGHTFLLTQVFFQQAGGPARDKDEPAPSAACWLRAQHLPLQFLSTGAGRARCPRRSVMGSCMIWARFP